MELHDARAALGDLEHLRVEARRDAHHAPRLELRPRLHHRFPSVVAEFAEEEHLGVRAGVALAEQPCPEDARGVEHHRITGAQELRQLVEHMMRDGPRRAVHHHQPALVATCRRGLRDA